MNTRIYNWIYSCLSLIVCLILVLLILLVFMFVLYLYLNVDELIIIIFYNYFCLFKYHYIFSSKRCLDNTLLLIKLYFWNYGNHSLRFALITQTVNDDTTIFLSSSGTVCLLAHMFVKQFL